MKFFVIYITIAIETSICALIAFLKICSYYELSHDSLIGKTASFKGNNVSQECKFLIDFLEQIAARESKDWFLADQILHISALL